MDDDGNERPQQEAVPLAGGGFVHSISDFEQIRVIGCGTYGRVVLARSVLTGEHVAIKKVREEYRYAFFFLSLPGPFP